MHARFVDGQLFECFGRIQSEHVLAPADTGLERYR